MPPFRFTRVIGIMAALAFSAFVYGGEPAPRPNMLVLLADDLGYGDLGAYGEPEVRTPNLDRLAAEGLRLTSYYAPGANCSPSRTGLMTGRIPTRAGITDWIPQLSPMHLGRDQVTIASLLRRAGYATCMAGKWHLCGGLDLADQPQPGDHGFDDWYGVQNLALPSHRDPVNFYRNGRPVGPLWGYSADLVAAEAVRFLSDRDAAKPFFLYVAFNEPHEPIATARQYVDLYPAAEPSCADHHGNITQLDAAVGRILQKLDEAGLRSNTLVFFTSDNGPAITPMHPFGSAGPLRDKKGSLYEGGIRVPGLLRWPGHVKPGSVSDEPVGGVDLLPTLCELAGIPMPAERKIDGASLLPLLDGRPVVRKTPLFWHFYCATTDQKVAMRVGDWKLLATLDQPGPAKRNHITAEDQRAMKTAELAGFELYNLRDDVGEQRDLAAQQPQRVETMAAQMRQLYHEVRDECPVWPEWTFANYDGSRIEWPIYWRPRGGAKAGPNLLKNPGFEAPLEPAWEKRTPDDADRKLYRGESAGRTGAAAVLENARPAYTRLRQGHDRSIAIAPGSLVELSAWIKSEQDERGETQLQLYSMDEAGGILAQPASAALAGRFDWTGSRVLTTVPEGTAYVMAYLQTRGGVGRVFFDDAVLVVRRPPVLKPPAPKVGLLTDLVADHACVKELKVLFEDGLKTIAPDDAKGLRDCIGAIVLYEAEIPKGVAGIATDFARQGGRVFMDIRSFARTYGVKAAAVEVGPVRDQPLEKQMAAGLRVVKRSDETSGFAPGQIMPRAGWPEGRLFVLPPGFSQPGLEVLAVAPGGEAGLVRLPVGKGFISASDVLSLREPYYRNVDAYYKYAPASGALCNPVRFGQYYPRKLTYTEFVGEMKRLAGELPGVRFQEEGPASEDYRLYSLNLGRPGAPLYFLYAAAHGSEWEPGYGLLTLARRLAQGELHDVVNLKEVEIKIVPYLNPWGYDHVRRQNAGGVDLNRQGDFAWEKFQGRDSNNDGRWAAGDYDWKGTAPFSEPEAQTYRKIAELPNLRCVLEFHGNTSAKNNKVGILPSTAKPDNELAALELQRIANERLRGRHLLRQNDEETVSQYLLDRVTMGGNVPHLKNTSMRDRYGLLIELAAGYGSSYGTVLQTDVVCELCRAMFLAYPPPAPRAAVPRGPSGMNTARPARTKTGKPLPP